MGLKSLLASSSAMNYDDACARKNNTSCPIETHTVKANNLVFEVDMCGTGKRLALCLHGFPELAFSWRYQLPLLAQLGYRAWAPNLRGYGRTSRPPLISDYTIDHLVADVVGLIDAAKPQSVLLVGHDWGGAVAWQTAIRHPSQIDRLVIMNMPHPVCFRNGLRKWRQLLRSWYIAAFQIPIIPELVLGARHAWLVGELIADTAVDPSRFPPSVLNIYRNAAASRQTLKAMLNYYRALRLNTWSPATSKLEDRPIKTPTLLIWGEEDVALGSDLLIGTNRYVQNLTVRTIPGVSHWVQQEAPETVNVLLETWLSNQPAPQFRKHG